MCALSETSSWLCLEAGAVRPYGEPRAQLGRGGAAAEALSPPKSAAL